VLVAASRAALDTVLRVKLFSPTLDRRGYQIDCVNGNNQLNLMHEREIFFEVMQIRAGGEGKAARVVIPCFRPVLIPLFHQLFERGAEPQLWRIHRIRPVHLYVVREKRNRACRVVQVSALSAVLLAQTHRHVGADFDKGLVGDGVTPVIDGRQRRLVR
jgi:hypothetical protein